MGKPGSVEEQRKRISAWSKAWKALSDEEKRPFVEQAAKEKIAKVRAMDEAGIPRPPVLADSEDAVPSHPSGPRQAAAMHLGDWRVDSRVSQGAYGDVVVVSHRTGFQAVAKVFKNEGDNSMKVEKEVYDMLHKAKEVNSKAYFLPLLDYNQNATITWLVLPWVVSGTLASHLKKKPLEFENVDSVLVQGAAALEYLHNKGWLHLDVKPKNMLWEAASRRLYLIDFSLSEKIPVQTGTVEAVCTKPYRPPEAWCSPPIVGQFTDSWSLGAATYEAATAEVLFENPKLIPKWEKDRLLGPTDKWMRLRSRARLCVWGLLHPDRRQRHSLSHVRQQMGAVG